MTALLAAAASFSVMVGIGLGWNFSYVTATAELADMTAPAGRGKIPGFTDLFSGLLARVWLCWAGLY